MAKGNRGPGFYLRKYGMFLLFFVRALRILQIRPAVIKFCTFGPIIKLDY